MLVGGGDALLQFFQWQWACQWHEEQAHTQGRRPRFDRLQTCCRSLPGSWAPTCSNTQLPATCSKGFGVPSTASAAGVTGRDSEDIATLLSSSWRKMRSLVLQKRNVQEFQFRQYLFAAQVRAGWQGCVAVAFLRC